MTQTTQKINYPYEMDTSEESENKLYTEALRVVNNLYSSFKITNEFIIKTDWKRGEYEIDMKSIHCSHHSAIPTYILKFNVEWFDNDFLKNEASEKLKKTNPEKYYENDIGNLQQGIRREERILQNLKKRVEKIEKYKMPKPNKNGTYKKEIYLICVKHLIALENNTTITEQTEQGNKIKDQPKSRNIPWLKQAITQLNGDDNTFINAISDNNNSELILINSEIKATLDLIKTYKNNLQKFKDLIQAIKNENKPKPRPRPAFSLTEASIDI